jgi:hypothetical protein
VDAVRTAGERDVEAIVYEEQRSAARAELSQRPGAVEQRGVIGVLVAELDRRRARFEARLDDLGDRAR